MIFQNDGSITAIQSDNYFSLGSCINNDNCQEIYEGECGDGRSSDASCVMWALSGGEYCNDHGYRRPIYM